MTTDHLPEEGWPHTEVEVSCCVRITPSPDAPADWLSRVTTDDFPYRRHDGLFTEQDGLNHLAYNAVANGVDDASRLDGWGDLNYGVLTLEVRDVETD